MFLAEARSGMSGGSRSGAVAGGTMSGFAGYSSAGLSAVIGVAPMVSSSSSCRGLRSTA